MSLPDLQEFMDRFDGEVVCALCHQWLDKPETQAVIEALLNEEGPDAALEALHEAHEIIDGVGMQPREEGVGY